MSNAPHLCRLATAGALALAPLAAGCGGDDVAAGGGDGLAVATTVAPLTSIVAQVAGHHAEITGIVPEGTNSHTFEPPPSAAKVLSRADVLFINGLQLEEPTRDLAEANLPGDAETVELGAHTITPDDYAYDFSFPKEGGKPNPHLWTNPPMAKRYAEIVKDELSELDPDNASDYAANYEAFATRVDGLDRAIRQATATVPPERRKLLTYHDAYAYFADEYGWEVIGAIQPSDFAEPSPKDVAALIRQIEATGVPAIFGSEVFPSPVLEQLGDQAGVRYIDVLRDDDLPGEPGDVEHSWLGLMQFDYVTMIDALGGDPAALEAVSLDSAVVDRAHYPQ